MRTLRSVILAVAVVVLVCPLAGAGEIASLAGAVTHPADAALSADPLDASRACQPNPGDGPVERTSMTVGVVRALTGTTMMLVGALIPLERHEPRRPIPGVYAPLALDGTPSDPGARYEYGTLNYMVIGMGMGLGVLGAVEIRRAQMARRVRPEVGIAGDGTIELGFGGRF